jgi:hypothetical protein
MEISGIAWDGGYGVNRVEVSTDGGNTWRAAELGQDHGRHSFRQFSAKFRPHTKGPVTVMAKASNRLGSTQTFELIHNPAGYHHNVVQKLTVEVV